MCADEPGRGGLASGLEDSLSTLLRSLQKDQSALKDLQELEEEDRLLLSEEAGRRGIHRTVWNLTELAASSSESSVSCLATRCLGEIGPVDLKATVLRPEEHIITSGKKEVDGRTQLFPFLTISLSLGSTSPFDFYVKPLVSWLLELSAAPSSGASTVRAVSDGLKVLLATKEAKKAISGGTIFMLAAPFKPDQVNYSE